MAIPSPNRRCGGQPGTSASSWGTISNASRDPGITQGQTGDYINTITSDVNNYEKILTHKIGDLAKSFALSLMLIVFVMTVYVPAGLILLAADLLLIPGLWLSFRMVRKYGQEKNDICAENVSSIVEYVSGIQTFRPTVWAV